MSKIYAPFTDEQVEKLIVWQNGEKKTPTIIGPTDVPGVYSIDITPHPFTCVEHDGCRMNKNNNEGILIPSNEGWTCPCGKYKQDWCHDFMVE